MAEDKKGQRMKEVTDRARQAGVGLVGLALSAGGLGYAGADIVTGSADDARGPIQPTEQHAPEVSTASTTSTTSPETTTSTTTSTALPEVNVGTGEKGAVIQERDANGNPGPVKPIDGSEVTPDGSFGSIEPVGTTSNGSTPPEGIEAQDQSVPSPTLGGVAPPPAG